MTERRGRPRKDAEERQENQFQTKLISLKPEAARAFDILKAEQGSRSGPRLAAEAIDLLLVKYGKEPIEKPATDSIKIRFPMQGSPQIPAAKPRKKE